MARARSLRMPRLPSLRVGSVLGVPVELHASWFLVLVLVGLGLVFGYFPVEFPGRPAWVDAVDGIVTAAAFYASIVAHEIAHSVVARRTGIGVQKVTLFVFGGVASLDREPRTPDGELVMALAGPGASLALSLVLFVSYVGAVRLGLPDALWAPLAYLTWVNLIIAGFNLLPGFPMDGGRVVRAAVWWATGDKATATRFAGWAGKAVGWALIIGAAIGTWRDGPGWLWLALIGVFIRGLAASGLRAAAEVSRWSSTPVGETVLDAPILWSPGTPVDTVRSESVADATSSAAVVAECGTLVGLVTSVDVARAPVGAGTLLMRDLMLPDTAGLMIDRDDSMEEAALRVRAGAPVLGVVGHGRLLGLVAPGTIERFRASADSRDAKLA